MLFSFNLLTIYSAAFLCALSYLDFLRWAVSHASSVYRCAVFPLSRNSGCSGARGSDGQYSSNMVHGIGDTFCCYSLLLDFVHRVGPGILHLYAMTTLLHRFAFRTRIFAPFSSTLFLWSFFLAQKSSMNRALDAGERGRGESDWTGLRSLHS
jgi:hypothetical protein